MKDTATIMAHILFRDGAELNLSSVLRDLDQCLEPASNGAYELRWDSEDIMVARFGRSVIFLVVGTQAQGGYGFSLTIALSPTDIAAIADPYLSRQHRDLIKKLVSAFTKNHATCGVLWQRAEAPVSAEIVECVVDDLAATLRNVAPGNLVALAHLGAEQHVPAAMDLVSVIPKPIHH